MTKPEDAVPSYDSPDGVKFLSPYSTGDYLPHSCANAAGLFFEQKQQNHLGFKKRKAKYLPRVKPGELGRGENLHKNTCCYRKCSRKP